MAFTKKNPAELKNEENIKSLKERIKSGKTGGVYVFSGEELYLMDHYSKELSKSAGTALDINYFTGRIDFEEFMNCFGGVSMAAAMDVDSMSMFDDAPTKKKKVIKLDNPNFGDLSETEGQDLCETLADIGEDDIVIVYKTGGESEREGKVHKSVIKKISESALCVTFDRESKTSPVLMKWLARHFDKAGIEYTRDDLAALTARVGSDMYTLDHECDKLSAYIMSKNRTKLTRADIELVCVKNSESVDFALSNALLTGSFAEAEKEISFARRNKLPALMLFGSVSAAVNTLCTVSSYRRKGMLPPEIAKKSGIHEYVVKKNCEAIRNRLQGSREKAFCSFAASKCLECDRSLKSFSGDEYNLIEMLMFELCKY